MHAREWNLPMSELAKTIPFYFRTAPMHEYKPDELGKCVNCGGTKETGYHEPKS